MNVWALLLFAHTIVCHDCGCGWIVVLDPLCSSYLNKHHASNELRNQSMLSIRKEKVRGYGTTTACVGMHIVN